MQRTSGPLCASVNYMMAEASAVRWCSHTSLNTYRYTQRCRMDNLNIKKNLIFVKHKYLNLLGYEVLKIILLQYSVYIENNFYIVCFVFCRLQS